MPRGSTGKPMKLSRTSLPTVPFSGKPLREMVSANKLPTPAVCTEWRQHRHMGHNDRNRNPIVMARLKGKRTMIHVRVAICF